MTAHLLLIGIDGLRIDRAFGTGLSPALDALAERGSFHRAWMEVPTISGPGWTTILTGTTHSEHGVFDNTFRDHRIADRSDLLSRIAAQDPHALTFAAAGWSALTDPAGPGPVIATRREDIDAGRHRVVALDGETYSYRTIDEEICRRVEVGITLAGPAATFVYFGQPDDAGHYWGVHTSAYDTAIRMTDARVARLVNTVERRMDLTGEEWIIAVTTDHGHIDAGGHGGDSDDERQTFLLVAAMQGTRPPIPENLAPHAFADYLISLR